MTETAPLPEEEIAETLGDLSQQTRNLVRREIQTARTEILEGAKQAAPALAGFLAAGLCAALGLASAYRWTLRILERRMSPAGAAFFAMLAYGGASLAVGYSAWNSREDLPRLLPTKTAQATVAGAQQAVTETRSQQPPS
jgi:hypothetical protein